MRAPSIRAMEHGYFAALDAEPAIHLPANVRPVEREIADRLVCALDAVGVAAFLRTGAPPPDAVGTIVIAPDRVFPGAGNGADLKPYAGSFMVAKDAPHDEAFRRQLPYVLKAAGVIAIDASTYALLDEAGVATVWLAGAFLQSRADCGAPDHPLIEGLGRTIRGAPGHLPWSERPIDVLSIEPRSPLRVSAWARMADAMSRFRTIVYEAPGDDLSDGREEALRRYLYARSKVVLHLHAETPAPISDRMIQETTAEGAVLLSEPSPPHLMLRPDRHYFEASARRMPDLVETLIRSDAGQARALSAINATRRRLASVSDLEAQGLALVNLLTGAGTIE